MIIDKDRLKKILESIKSDRDPCAEGEEKCDIYQLLETLNTMDDFDYIFDNIILDPVRMAKPHLYIPFAFYLGFALAVEYMEVLKLEEIMEIK